MNRYIIFVILFLIGTSLSAQNLNPRKSQLKKIFRKSISQDSRKTISTLSNPWVIDNTDNLYFKADTIKLINIKMQYKYDFCQKVNWSFYRNSKFYLVESQTFREPSSAKVSNENSRYWVRIKRNNIGLILTTYNISGMIDQFLVISINRNETKDEIKLKRLMGKASD
jgi:hypothetical protein